MRATAPYWAILREAGEAFCPPFAIVAETPERLALVLRTADSGEQVMLHYRSERGLFLRTFYLVIEAELNGDGPPEAGTLVLRRGKLRWRRPKPRDARRWSDNLRSPDVQAALKQLQIERLRLSWEPPQALWRLALETLSGSITVTFFPPLMTPNPLTRDEARAIESLLRALRRAQMRTRA